MSADTLDTLDPAVPRTPEGTTWVAVCRLADLVPERGAAALLGDDQVALVRLVDDTVLAVQQQDPFTGAHVLSRGIVGSRGEAPTLASPLHKQVFDLRTGACLDPVGAEPRHLRTWPVRVQDDVVLVGVTATTPSDGSTVDGGATDGATGTQP